MIIQADVSVQFILACCLDPRGQVTEVMLLDVVLLTSFYRGSITGHGLMYLFLNPDVAYRVYCVLTPEIQFV